MFSCMCVFMSIDWSIYWSIGLFIYLSICLSIYLHSLRRRRRSPGISHQQPMQDYTCEWWELPCHCWQGPCRSFSCMTSRPNFLSRHGDACKSQSGRSCRSAGCSEPCRAASTGGEWITCSVLKNLHWTRQRAYMKTACSEAISWSRFL